MPAPGSEYLQFEMEFPFDETADQLKAIEEIHEDLGKEHPMDRLLCGDVGYGKTEVAMRAAYRTVLGQRQVVILVPTTVLAFQHFESFKKRFENTGVQIEMVSRLRTSQENRHSLEKMKNGKLDILIGTHRLLSSDVQFANLGLLVVDEEHRFGVVHKERLKKLCETVHVLSMTATPIPRTLNMAMAGIKSISIITTPPPDRLSVRTFVCKSEAGILREAIENELSREGQLFFVHNRIQTIYSVAEKLQKIVPRLKIGIVHGEISPEELENKMLAFYRGEFDCLLTTTIIESGLDIPKANTILIDRADRFGLAQLYQLRGRVGRSSRRAYCYLLCPEEEELTKEGRERLQILERYSELGSGFHIASHDLEMRGAGDLLGKSQSGHLQAIGVDLYLELLEQTMLEMKGETRTDTIDPEIILKVPAFIPGSYLPDVSERVNLYRRLSMAKNEEELSQLENEMRDRFGRLPDEVLNLMYLLQMKLVLKQLEVIRLHVGPKKSSLQFWEKASLNPQKLVQIVQDSKGKYSFTPDHKLVIPQGEADHRKLIGELTTLKDLLSTP